MSEIRTLNANFRASTLDRENRTVEFEVSNDQPDRMGTVINMQNWNLDNFMRNPVVFYNHEGYGGMDGSDPDDVLGSAETFIERGRDGDKLVARIQFETAEVNPKADKIFRKIEAGTLRSTSAGFLSIPDKNGVHLRPGNRDMGEDPELLYFHGQELIEISVAAIPANPTANVRGYRQPHTRQGPYVPPQDVADRAQQALNIRERTGNPNECGTRTGWTRANQLAKRENVSLNTVKRVRSFLARHLGQVEGNLEDQEDTSCQKLMIYAWGGREGKRWADRIVAEADEGRTISRAEPDELEEGDYVAWDSAGGEAEGVIDTIERDGQIDVPDSSFTINGTPDDPAALITVAQEQEDGTYELSDTQVGHRFSTLRKREKPQSLRTQGTRMVPDYEELPLDPESGWDSEAAEQRIRRFASEDGSGDKETIDFSVYQRAFAYVDPDMRGDFGGYKLPHHDVNEAGELVTVFSGVVAAAAAVNGARGGVDVPDEDMPAIRQHLASHYREFGEEPPFEDMEQDNFELKKKKIQKLLKLREREMQNLES